MSYPSVIVTSLSLSQHRCYCHCHIVVTVTALSALPLQLTVLSLSLLSEHFYHHPTVFYIVLHCCITCGIIIVQEPLECLFTVTSLLVPLISQPCHWLMSPSQYCLCHHHVAVLPPGGGGCRWVRESPTLY